jgi:hypothetical protein
MIKEADGTNVPYEEWLYDGLRVELMKDKIILVEANSPNYETSFGLKVGDPSHTPNSDDSESVRIETENGIITVITIHEFMD